MKATIKWFTGSGWKDVTGTIKRKYPQGLTIETIDGLICYATFDRVTYHNELRALLW